MGRPSFHPTDEQRRMVRALSAAGNTQDQIAAVLGISSRTVRKHFRRDLDRAAVEANTQVAQSLYKKAVGGDTTAAIFWLKCRANWRERGTLEPGSGPKREVTRIFWRTTEQLKENLPPERNNHPPAAAPISDFSTSNEGEAEPETELATPGS